MPSSGPQFGAAKRQEFKPSLNVLALMEKSHWRIRVVRKGTNVALGRQNLEPRACILGRRDGTACSSVSPARPDGPVPTADLHGGPQLLQRQESHCFDHAHDEARAPDDEHCKHSALLHGGGLLIWAIRLPFGVLPEALPRQRHATLTEQPPVQSGWIDLGHHGDGECRGEVQQGVHAGNKHCQSQCQDKRWQRVPQVLGHVCG
mmetsp:Transcript_51033/g.145768  ORF Transcript_51033/g.145768 Transcript_51033/m.145768 type:complete len:204 (+) Transcript_51033:27-638(+)